MKLFTIISSTIFLIAIIVALIFSYAYCFKKFNPVYLKLFPPYLTMSLISVLPFGMPQLSRFSSISQIIFTFFEMIIFFLFFSFVLFNKKIKRIMIIPISIIVICILDIIKNGVDKNYDLYVLIDLISITLLSLAYFKKIFTEDPTKDLFREPSFWISCGCLIYFTGITPLFIFEYLVGRNRMWQIAPVTYTNLYSINYILFTIMALLLIKAFICRKRISISA
jgi:hypothetical protein